MSFIWGYGRFQQGQHRSINISVARDWNHPETRSSHPGQISDPVKAITCPLKEEWSPHGSQVVPPQWRQRWQHLWGTLQKTADNQTHTDQGTPALPLFRPIAHVSSPRTDRPTWKSLNSFWGSSSQSVTLIQSFSAFSFLSLIVPVRQRLSLVYRDSFKPELFPS